jgi:hypothetical protein
MKGQLSLKVGEWITTGLPAALYRRPGADMGDQFGQGPVAFDPQPRRKRPLLSWEGQAGVALLHPAALGGPPEGC